jgi:hypothetical protein
MLEVALEVEVAEYVKEHREERDAHDHRQVVRNGSHPERELVTGVGKVPVRQPRVNDRREGEKFHQRYFTPVCAAGAQHRRLDSSAVSQRHFNLAFQRL